jgi:hypothetical protein
LNNSYSLVLGYAFSAALKLLSCSKFSHHYY